MSEQTPETPAAEPQASEKPDEAPPWGEDFDPARAWHTIQSLREREKELSKRPVLTTEQQQQLDEYNRLVEASKSEAERQREALTAAEREAETARAEAIRYRVAATHGVPADHFDLLGSGSEEEIEARAQKIAQLLAVKAQEQAQPGSPPPTRPVEQLRPGATPGEAESPDDVLYKQLFG